MLTSAPLALNSPPTVRLPLLCSCIPPTDMSPTTSATPPIVTLLLAAFTDSAFTVPLMLTSAPLALSSPPTVRRPLLCSCKPATVMSPRTSATEAIVTLLLTAVKAPAFTEPLKLTSLLLVTLILSVTTSPFTHIASSACKTRFRVLFVDMSRISALISVALPPKTRLKVLPAFISNAPVQSATLPVKAKPVYVAFNDLSYTILPSPLTEPLNVVIT